MTAFCKQEAIPVAVVLLDMSSTVCLASSKGACEPSCEFISKIVGLEPQISLNFTEVIQAYAIFTLLRDASFHLAFQTGTE
jgi:hypothetical protein